MSSKFTFLLFYRLDLLAIIPAEPGIAVAAGIN